MDSLNELIQASILRELSEGVLVIRLNGKIAYVNPSAEKILNVPAEKLLGKPFAACFFLHPENDVFNQTVLDAVYDASVSHKNVVPYFTGSVTRQLHLTTSFLHEGETAVALILVIRDVSELSELRDAAKAAERIRALNEQLSLRNRLLHETFGRFLTEDIVRYLLETPDGLSMGGEKREVTVLMSDLRGFTARCESMDVSDLLRQLNHYLGEMTEIIQGNSGTIIEFIGDSIMALFGAPLPSENHAGDAVRTAVEMQQRMDTVNRWNREHGFPDLEMGIGVHTGEAIVGNIGSEKRSKYGAVGSTVNLCARIESYSVGGDVLISPETRKKTGRPLDILWEREVSPKGVSQPLVISCVGGIDDISCAQNREKLRELKRPVNLVFHFIRGHSVENTVRNGALLAVSAHYALLQSSADLKVFDNIVMDIQGCTPLFAKVTDLRGTDWFLRLTSVPDGFSPLLDSLDFAESQAFRIHSEPLH